MKYFSCVALVVQMVLVIHNLNILDAALACTAQDSLYGEENELHHKAGCALLRWVSINSHLLAGMSGNIYT